MCFRVSWLTIWGSHFELQRRWYVMYALMILSDIPINFMSRYACQHIHTHRMCSPHVPLVMFAHVISAACRAAESDVSSSGKLSRDSDNSVSMWSMSESSSSRYIFTASSPTCPSHSTFSREYLFHESCYTYLVILGFNSHAKCLVLRWGKCDVNRAWEVNDWSLRHHSCYTPREKMRIGIRLNRRHWVHELNTAWPKNKVHSRERENDENGQEWQLAVSMMYMTYVKEATIRYLCKHIQKRASGNKGPSKHGSVSQCMSRAYFFMGHDLGGAASEKERVPGRTKVESRCWDTPDVAVDGGILMWIRLTSPSV